MPSSATRRRWAEAGSERICSRDAIRGISPRPILTWARLSATAGASEQSAGGSPLPPADARDQHPDLFAIFLIIAAEIADEVAFLVADGDQHIDRHAKREEQMAFGHPRR